MFILTAFDEDSVQPELFNDINDLADAILCVTGDTEDQRTVSAIAGNMSFGDCFTFQNLFKIRCVTDDEAAALTDPERKHKKLSLSKKDHDAAVKEIDALRTQLGFLSDMIGFDGCTADIVDTHMRLLRSSYDVLAGLFHADPVSSALAAANRLCREATGRVRELESRLAADVTVDAAMAKLVQCENWFRIWSRLSGWRWIRTEWTPRGLLFSTSDEVKYAPIRTKTICSDDSLPVEAAKDAVPYAFLGLDLVRDTFHGTVLDTQKNRDAIKNLFTNTFEGAVVSKFESYAEENYMVLRAEGLVPWASIEKWRDSVLAPKTDTNTDEILVAYDIDWDDDGDKDVSRSLPSEMQVPAGMTDADKISDWLTETTGFCHFGFNLRTEPKKT